MRIIAPMIGLEKRAPERAEAFRAVAATTTRSRAGIVEAVEATGVWVRMDEALARAA